MTPGSYSASASRNPGADQKSLWRGIGLPKIAFITIVFLCLVLLLLVFSAGRIHAQRIMRSRAIAVAIPSTNSTSSHSNGLLTASIAQQSASGKHLKTSFSNAKCSPPSNPLSAKWQNAFQAVFLELYSGKQSKSGKGILIRTKS